MDRPETMALTFPRVLFRKGHGSQDPHGAVSLHRRKHGAASTGLPNVRVLPATIRHGAGAERTMEDRKDRVNAWEREQSLASGVGDV